jgi:hypothetical protein
LPDDPIFQKKAWTLLVYMAGDNDLDSQGTRDLDEMRALPSDEHLHVAVQFDSLYSKTYRYRIIPGDYVLIGQPLDEVNTGDPKNLTTFITWGMEHFPAEQTALVIWNHGTGLRDLPPDFNYSALRAGESRKIIKELRRTLFRPTIEKINAGRHRLRGIAIDATDRDYLDNIELKNALLEALPEQNGQRRRLALVGFDACLMSEVEIAYQLKDVAAYMVSSQELEPGVGWPYGEILKKIAQALENNQALGACQLSEIIIESYIYSVKEKASSKTYSYTQSTLDLGQAQHTFELVRELVDRLAQQSILENSTIEKAFRIVFQDAKRFSEREQVDLSDWLTILQRETRGNAGAPFRQALLNLQAHLKKGQGLIVDSQAIGKDRKRVHGVSIYWPELDYLPVIERLDFKGTGWWRLAKWAATDALPA